MQDYWDIYDAHRSEIREILLRQIAENPEFALIMRTGGVRPSSEAETAELQRRAIMDNDWAPFLDSLAQRGQQYARAGFSFQAWFDVVTMFRGAMRPLLLQAYGDSAERLLAALDGMDRFANIMLGVIGDSYQEVRQQIALEQTQSERKFRGLLESAPDGIVVVNQSGIIEIVNSQAERIFGYQRAELTGQPVEILIPNRFREGHTVYRSNFMAQPVTRPMGIGLELYGRRHDGSEFPVEISLSPLETDSGQLITASIRDVTERKETEREVEELNAALQRRATELEVANRELEAFSYSVSHDLRAPLRTIDGFSQALLEDYGDQLPGEARNFLERVRNAAQRMAKLIDDLLELSRISRVPVDRKPIDVTALARSIADELQQAEPQRKVKFEISPKLEAHGDSQLIRIAMQNLMNNAWKFTSKVPEARIEIGERQNDGQRVFYVRDNGAGFDMAYASKLFGAFQRLHAVSEFPGTGIGLATVQRIVHKHGGRVWAESMIDQGATFYFTLQAPEASWRKN